MKRTPHSTPTGRLRFGNYYRTLRRACHSQLFGGIIGGGELIIPFKIVLPGVIPWQIGKNFVFHCLINIAQNFLRRVIQHLRSADNAAEVLKEGGIVETVNDPFIHCELAV